MQSILWVLKKMWLRKCYICYKNWYFTVSISFLITCGQFAGIKKQMPSPVFNNGIFFQITVPFWKFMRSRGELLIFFLILCHNFEIFRVPSANYWYFSHKHGTIFQKYAVFFLASFSRRWRGIIFQKHSIIFLKCPISV